MRHLLFFDDFARESEGMAAAGKNEAGDAAVDRRQESEFAFLEINLDIAAAKFDAISGNEFVGGCGIETQGVEGVVEFARRLIGGTRDRQRNETRQNEKCRPRPHARSVVTFGMTGQGSGG